MGVKPKRDTPRRRDAPRWTAEEWEWATQVLLVRSGARCEHCRKDLNGRGERHHRKRREDGGDRLSNLLLVLPECHTAIHTESPELSRQKGWIVSAFNSDPATMRVQIGSRWWYLDDDGGKSPAAASR